MFEINDKNYYKVTLLNISIVKHLTKIALTKLCMKYLYHKVRNIFNICCIRFLLLLYVINHQKLSYLKKYQFILLQNWEIDVQSEVKVSVRLVSFGNVGDVGNNQLVVGPTNQ